jgi:8-oxo-dGTP pyrophosphatase MutT (NUDIX family)
VSRGPLLLPDWLQPLRDSLTGDLDSRPDRTRPRERAAGTGGRPAGVLVLFGEDRDGPDLLFIERSSALRAHPGQVAFPGGGIEDVDADVVAAALREAQEETGLDPAGVEVFGELDPLGLSVSGFQVTPVLAWWRDQTPVAVVDPGEVAAVQRIPISALTDPGNRYVTVHPRGHRGPGFLIGELLIWGFTAYVLDGILTRGGWQRPWDNHRTMAVPSRYLGRQPVAGPDLDAPDLDAPDLNPPAGAEPHDI